LKRVFKDGPFFFFGGFFSEPETREEVSEGPPALSTRVRGS